MPSGKFINMKKLELKNIKKHTMKPSFLMALVQYVIHQSQAALWENQEQERQHC